MRQSLVDSSSRNCCRGDSCVTFALATKEKGRNSKRERERERRGARAGVDSCCADRRLFALGQRMPSCEQSCDVSLSPQQPFLDSSSSVCGVPQQWLAKGSDRARLRREAELLHLLAPRQGSFTALPWHISQLRTSQHFASGHGVPVWSP